ncbi:FAD dependent oxidoreductase [Mycena alexandri]|uniref:FAD dependent oxidoreductase n=1 Tax=Mycena alexandri TaxID=1745969 RepID=A0AAD6WU02_9AGAR|nr:FAD dependent oxidoreductase [Mycena alexandri]
MSTSAVLQLDASKIAFEDPSRTQASTLPVPDPTRSFWIDSPGANPLAGEGSEGAFTADADICIIGSGITGVSAAYHLSLAVERGDIPRLANSPLRVVILEARNFCSGATGRNGGHLTPMVFLDFCAYQSKYGTDQAVRSLELENHNAAEMVDLIRSEGWTEAIDLVENGHTTLFFTPSEFAGAKADFAAAQKAGMALPGVRCWLTKEETHTKYGSEYPSVELGGFNLWPLKFVTQLYQLAKAKAVNFDLILHTRTPATSISRSSSPSRRWALHTHRGVLNCSHVIHATNAYASHLLPHMAGPAGIIPTRGQVMALRASVPGDESFKCSWDGNEGFEYWFPRPIAAGDEAKPPLIILGGGREDDPDFEYYQADDSVVNPIVGRSLRRFLPSVFPGQFEKDREPELEWTGIMAFTKLKDPFVGPVVDQSEFAAGEKFKGQYISAGYSGHGMPRAFSCAAIVAGMVVADISGSRWEVPEWFPEVFLTTTPGRSDSPGRKA